jgi:hypothetical protein
MIYLQDPGPKLGPMTHWVPIYGSGTQRYLRPTHGAPLRWRTRPAGSLCSLSVALVLLLGSCRVQATDHSFPYADRLSRGHSQGTATTRLSRACAQPYYLSDRRGSAQSSIGRCFLFIFYARGAEPANALARAP